MDSNNPENHEEKHDRVPGYPNLRNGGTNKGGTGRPKSEIRAAAAAGFDKALPVLTSIVAGEAPYPVTPAEMLKAIDLLGKYGGLQQVDQTSNDQPIQTTVINFGEMSVDEREKMLENLPE